MVSILLTVNVLICIGLVILILLQRSDPASGGMFGGTGGAGGPVIRNPLARPTAWLAAAFLVLSLVLAYLNKGTNSAPSLMETLPAPQAEAPAEVSATLPAPSLLGATAATPTVPQP